MPNENINQSTPSSKSEGIEPGLGEPTAPFDVTEIDPSAPIEKFHRSCLGDATINQK
jgi:hypothetical protein